MLIKDPRHPLFFGIVCTKCNFYTTCTFEFRLTDDSYNIDRPMSHKCFRCDFVQVGVTSISKIIECIVGKTLNEEDLLSEFKAIQDMCDALGVLHEIPNQLNINPYDQMFDV